MLTEFRETADGLLVPIHIKPSRHRFSVQIKTDLIEVSTKPPAHNNKANIEILKEFRKLLKKPVSIVSGSNSKKKILLVKKGNKEEFKQVIASSG